MKQIDELSQIIVSNTASTDAWFELVDQLTFCDESKLLACLNDLVGSTPSEATEQAHMWTAEIREQAKTFQGVETLLNQYDLTTQEGIALMCLAESLLRIPDKTVADRLIRNKLSQGDWQGALEREHHSFWTHASTWGLLLTGKLTTWHSRSDTSLDILKKLIAKMGEMPIRKAIKQAMRWMGQQFVLGETIEKALKASDFDAKTTYSYDMLGEAALTYKDAEKYLEAYRHAIIKTGEIHAKNQNSTHIPLPSVSIKLSALHPRYESLQWSKVESELIPAVVDLANLAEKAGIALTIDAEEADRLVISLKILAKVLAACKWPHIGLAVQAYSKRTIAVLGLVESLGREFKRLIPVRLVKGAYWDSEVKWAQEFGLPDYPVYTRKENTDLSYLACAKWMLETAQFITPQFATHNAQTVAAILSYASGKPVEFQRLHGMGESLYRAAKRDIPNLICRVYAPVGAHEELLPYLVRRLLENGANTSFVHQVVSEKTDVDHLLQCPIERIQQKRMNGESISNQKIPKPRDILGRRQSAKGLNMQYDAERNELIKAVMSVNISDIAASFGLKSATKEGLVTKNPYTGEKIATLPLTSQSDVPTITKSLHEAFGRHAKTTAESRAAVLKRFADILESHQAELIALCIKEAGKTWQDSIDEVREAVDFARYYADEAETLFEPIVLPGPTGEENTLMHLPRGVMVCISPWNFPLAIFVGQVLAAWVTGNTVLAKPAEQTPLIAAFAIDLFYQAGAKEETVSLIQGAGETVGAAAVASPMIQGVVFTGSHIAAKHIQRALAEKPGPILPLIAETGGQNAMIVDSSALPEQVVKDVVQSAFKSAGQRCSALRILCLQSEIADKTIEMLKGAMQCLQVGDPSNSETDVGPVIDRDAASALTDYQQKLRASGQELLCFDPEEKNDHVVAPSVYEIQNLTELKSEQFGPILHVYRYEQDALPELVTSINDLGFGLTAGIHTRDEITAEAIARQLNVGNVYINRNTVGAVVGVQPFGGCGLSGTGPKAGGPRYLHSFVTEKTCSINTTALGGNTELLTL